jgi:hypothetical protein
VTARPGSPGTSATAHRSSTTRTTRRRRGSSAPLGVVLLAFGILFALVGAGACFVGQALT